MRRRACSVEQPYDRGVGFLWSHHLNVPAQLVDAHESARPTVWPIPAIALPDKRSGHVVAPDGRAGDALPLAERTASESILASACGSAR